MLTLYLATGILGGASSPSTGDHRLLAAFRLRYVAFATVGDERINYWLTDADDVVGDNWCTDIADRARLAYTAHALVTNGEAIIAGAIPGGVTSFKSGTFAATIDSQAANRTGYNATSYGREFLDLQRRCFAGPLLAGYVCA